MPVVVIPTESAVPIRRPKGSNVAVFNQSTIDVYFDTDPFTLNATPPGTTPSQAPRLAAGNGQFEWQSYPGIVWFRAVSAYTNIMVTP